MDAIFSTRPYTHFSFFEACRGSRFMHGVVVADSYEDGEDVTDAAAETTRNIPTEADFLISYSTVPGK